MSAGPRVRCDKCHAILQSKHRHHFVVCPCGNVGVDGGAEYFKVSANDPRTVTVLPESPTDPCQVDKQPIPGEETAGVSDP